jgi:hypothetical protein
LGLSRFLRFLAVAVRGVFVRNIIAVRGFVKGIIAVRGFVRDIGQSC